MDLTVDDVLEKIGSMGRYQFMLVMMMGFMKMFGYAFQAMISTFLSAEPPWRCKDNSFVCNLTGTFKPGDDNYKFRCSIPRGDWEFDTSEFNSVVSEVSYSTVVDSTLKRIAVDVDWQRRLIERKIGDIIFSASNILPLPQVQ